MGRRCHVDIERCRDVEDDEVWMAHEPRHLAEQSQRTLAYVTIGGVNDVKVFRGAAEASHRR